MQTQDTASNATAGAVSTPAAEDDLHAQWRRVVGRRSFLRGVGLAGAAALPGSALLSGTALASASGPSAGDVAILRLLAAIELIESDLWQQYNELGGPERRQRGVHSCALEPRRRHAPVHRR